MDENIEKLIKQRDAFKEKADKLDMAIEALQSICEHDLKYTGHGHKDDEYTCAKCGEVEYR